VGGAVVADRDYLRAPPAARLLVDQRRGGTVRIADLEVHGTKALNQQLVDLGAELGAKLIARAARKAFEPVLQAARQLVPVDSGLTRDHIRLTVKRPTDGDAVVVVGLKIAKAKDASVSSRSGRKATDPSWRWHFIELGTAFQTKRPFLRPALDQNAEGVINALKDELAAEINRVVRKRARAAVGT
jgi:HK97 gp10 family phage protein